jgi:hypothetical protein
MRNNSVHAITDAELRDVIALIEKGRSIPAVIVAAIVERLEAAETWSSAPDLRTAFAA